MKRNSNEGGKEIEKKTWQMWKSNYTLPRMSREVSKLTHWSEYLSLCFVVNYLHRRKGIGFSRKQLKYAFSKIPKDEVEGSRVGAWKWLLQLGGYEYNEGKKSGLRVAKNTPILSSHKQKIVSDEVSIEG